MTVFLEIPKSPGSWRGRPRLKLRRDLQGKSAIKGFKRIIGLDNGHKGK
jgi:hypothetical protein